MPHVFRFASSRTARRLLLIIALIALTSTGLAGPLQARQATAEIWEIQGPSTASPYTGRVATTENNIVTAVGVNGFFMQTPPERADGDDQTSDGILVYTGSRPAVQRGDLVTVTGTVEEYYGMTEFSNTGLEVIVVGAADLPAPVVLESPFPPAENQVPDAFERYEGMLVQVNGAVATGPAVVYYEGQAREEYEAPVVLGHSRAFREPGIAYPAEGEPEHVEVFDNNPQVFEFGFGGGANSADFAQLDVEVSTGAVLSAAGVINYRFSRYQLWPLAGTLTIEPGAAPLPRPVSAPQPGELTIGTQNVQNLFDMERDRGKEDSNDTPRTVEEYQLQLDKLALQICEVLQAPDIVALQEVEKIETLESAEYSDLTEAITAACGVDYTPYLIEGSDVRGIDNAFLVRETVEVLAVYQAWPDEVFRPTVATGPETLYERPPLVLEAIYDPEGAAFPVTVVSVHLKSYLDSERARYRELRYQQALHLALFAQGLQEADPGIHLVITGDFNAYQFNDGLAPMLAIIAGQVTDLGAENSRAIWWPEEDIVQPDLVIETTDRLEEEERYSYVYDGSAQALDHIVASQALDAYVIRVEYGRGNADAPFNHADDPTTPLRSSDHDGAVIAIQTAGYEPPPDPTLAPDPTATPTPEAPPAEPPPAAPGGLIWAVLIAVAVLLGAAAIAGARRP
jgi:hypothetical protein